MPGEIGEMHMYRSSLSALTILALCAAVSFAGGKDKKSKSAADPQDEIQVVGHIAVTGGPITNFLVTPHYSSYYLYAERGTGRPVMLLDVTKPDKPLVLGDVAYASAGGGNLTLVAGTAALVSSEPAAAQTGATPQTIRIMNFSNPKNPAVAREFTGVTAMSRDDRRGLVFLADSNGIWILQQKLATDPAVEKAYSDYVFLSH